MEAVAGRPRLVDRCHDQPSKISPAIGKMSLMDKPIPSAKSLSSAWDACRHARNPYNLHAETLVMALLHGAGIGAARAPTTLQEGTEGTHLQAARLFVALQVKLAREPDCLVNVPAGWFDQLLAAIPKPWAHALKARVLRPETAQPIHAPARPIVKRNRPHVTMALADMEAVGRT
jgi:hypothetical protein